MVELPAGTIKRIHVNQFDVRRRSEKPLRVKTSRANIAARAVTIDGSSEVVFRPDKPLSCGARCWIETHARIVIR